MPIDLKSLMCISIMLISSAANGVTGGKNTDAGAAPWTAALIDTALPIDPECSSSGAADNFCQHYCGGVLIAPQWVVTAGHCLIDRQADLDSPSVRILLNTTNLNSSLPDVYSIAEVITRPEWENTVATTYSHDIALLRLNRISEVAPASLMRDAELDALESSLPNDAVEVFGWGRLKDGGDFPNILQRVAIDLQPTGCSSPFFLSDLMICAGELTPGAIEADDDGDRSPQDIDGEGACEKDSGGPLVHFSEDGAPLVSGLVSWGQNGLCGATDSPTVYTRTPYYVNWIEQQTSAAADPLVDVGVTINAAKTTNNGSEPVQVILENFSLSNSASGASFEIVHSGTGILSLDTHDAGLSCSAGPTSFTCNADAPLAAGASLSATFELTELESLDSDDTQALLSATASTNESDYRIENNEISHWLARTTKPSLSLLIDGLIVEASAGRGRLSLFLTVANVSDHVTATDVTIAIDIAADHVLFNDGGLGCDLETIVCPIGTLLPGESVQLERIELRSPFTVDGILIAEASATEGSFPEVADGEILPRKGRDYIYPESTTPAGPGAVRYGDGAGSLSFITLATLCSALLRRRRRGGLLS